MRAPKNKEPVRVRLLGTGVITMAKGALRGVGGGSYKRSCGRFSLHVHPNRIPSQCWARRGARL